MGFGSSYNVCFSLYDVISAGALIENTCGFAVQYGSQYRFMKDIIVDLSPVFSLSPECMHGQFFCVGSRVCVSESARCDGQQQCADRKSTRLNSSHL